MTRERRVLLVDDDADFTDAVRLTLEAHGCRVFVAHTREEALQTLRQERVDVAVLDMMMDEPDAGAMLAHSLRRQPELKDIPVVLVTSVREKTGYGPAPGAPEPREWLGVDAWLDKPVSPQALLDTIEGLLDG